MARGSNPARLVVALSVAAVLAIFLLYTSIVGGTPQLQPSQLAGHHGKVQLVGMVVAHPSGDADGAGLRFTLRDEKGPATVPVLYHGTVPDLFRSGRHVAMQGRLRNAVFVATPNSLLTKCPSKYSPTHSN